MRKWRLHFVFPCPDTSHSKTTLIPSISIIFNSPVSTSSSLYTQAPIRKVLYPPFLYWSDQITVIPLAELVPLTSTFDSSRHVQISHGHSHRPKRCHFLLATWRRSCPKPTLSPCPFPTSPVFLPNIDTCIGAAAWSIAQIISNTNFHPTHKFTWSISCTVYWISVSMLE